MSSIGVAYSAQSGGASYNVVFSLFSGAELSRTYAPGASFERGASGQQLIQGRPGRQTYIWAVSARLDELKAKELDDMFKAWDVDRGNGLPAAVGITDETLFDSLTTAAVFTTPPSFIKSGPNHFTVSVGLTEV
jgi:hypothetical protein